jgi:two-component system response regulator FixJ
MASAKVFLIDDQEPVRSALGEMLSVYGFDVETFASATAFLDSPAATGAGCIVSDVRMPGMDGIALVRECQRRGLGMAVVLISGHADVPMAVAAIKAGAEDMIEKPIDDAQLVAAINRGLARNLEHRNRLASAEALSGRFEQLTQREAEVFDLVAEGLTSPAIAVRLGISTRTVESYRAKVMDKMQADSVAALVRQAVLLGRSSP